MRTAHLAFACLFVLCAPAETTRTWEQTRFEEFEKGAAHHVALRSDGRLALAPRFDEIYDAPLAYLWALARDSRGNLYAGGGPGGRVFKIPAAAGGDPPATAGKAAPFFETEALEIHALAVDGHDNVYAATSPDAKVYKIDRNGRSSLFVDPKVKYVWAMAFNSQGDLFLATGDKGEIYRVTPAGRASLFFKTDESHIRSLLIDKNSNLLIGTDPGGLLIRVPASGGKGFVLYQSAKKEITALVLGPDGALYAAGVGTRSRTAPPLPPVMPVPTVSPLPGALGGQRQGRVGVSGPEPQPLALPSALRTGVTGGSEVFRIGADGEPRKLWSSASDIVYALGFSAQGKLLIGTGNEGRIFQIESDNVYSLLLKAAPAQVTSFLQDAGGRVYASTGNVGKVYRLGPELERKGTFESDVFDAGIFSRWGRLSWKGAVPQGTSVTLYARSGNLGTPAEYWSGWSKPITTEDGARLETPPARFVQWRAVLETHGSESPLLHEVEIAYQPKNVAPAITEMEITPPNYKFPDQPAVLAPSTQNLTLPPLGGKPSPPVISLTPQAARSMVRAKGYLGARWLAQDENGDDLVYKIEIRGVGEQDWKLLREKVDQAYLSWDSTAFADGLYQLRVTASDAPSNPSGEALNTSRESDPFVIDNTPPAISTPSAALENGRIRVRFHTSDALSDIDKSEYSLDGGPWRLMLPVTRLFDSRQLDYDFLTDEAKPGEHTVAIRVWDENENQATAKVVVK